VACAGGAGGPRGAAGAAGSLALSAQATPAAAGTGSLATALLFQGMGGTTGTGAPGPAGQPVVTSASILLDGGAARGRSETISSGGGGQELVVTEGGELDGAPQNDEPTAPIGTARRPEGTDPAEDKI